MDPPPSGQHLAISSRISLPSALVPSRNSTAALGLSGDLDEGEAVQDADVVDRSSGRTAPSRSAQRRSSSAMPLRSPRLTKSFTDLRPRRSRLGSAGSRPSRPRRLGRLSVRSRRRGARRVLEPLLGGLPLADRGLHVALDAADLVALGRGDEGDRAAGAPDPAGAADPVDVDLRGGRHVVVDDVGDVLDVEPAGGDVGRDQQPHPVVLEGDHHAVADALADVAVQRLDVEAFVLQRLLQPRGADFGAAEDDRLLGFLGLQQLDQARRLLLGRDLDVGLRRSRRRSASSA